MNLNGLANLSELEELSLHYCKSLSAQEFVKIHEKCPNLSTLYLQKVNIASLEGIERLSRLRSLFLTECHNLSKEKILAFQNKRPDVLISADVLDDEN